MKKKILQVKKEKRGKKGVIEKILDLVFMVIIMFLLYTIIFNNANVILTVIFISACSYAYFKFIKEYER